MRASVKVGKDNNMQSYKDKAKKYYLNMKNILVGNTNTHIKKSKNIDVYVRKGKLINQGIIYNSEKFNKYDTFKKCGYKCNFQIPRAPNLKYYTK